MNKAFIREPDRTVERCPQCGTPGQSVGSATLDAFVRPELRQEMGETAYFCPSESCSIAYFDPFERLVSIEGLVRPVYPKDSSAPVCGCFGVGTDAIEADCREGVATRTRALLDRAKSAATRCATMSPNGQSCVPFVQRYFMKCRAGR